MAQLLYVIASLHVVLCPFTKVEESFNIQAFHDILYHRHNLSQYDHNEFPGVVPRTFVGPLIISTLSAPMAAIFHLFGINKFWMQYVVRLVLALTVIGAWTRLRNTLQKQFGNTFAWWFTLITVTQYHFMFYMSRPLPNILALPLVLLAFEGWISGKHKQFLVSAGASMIIFRSELAVLFGLFLIIDLYFKKLDFKTLLKIVLPAGAGLVALTVAVDSVFWGRLLWPEAQVFWYNTVLNKSSNWGTSPFLWYLYSALPRGLGPSLLLAPLGAYLDKRMVQLVAPALVYVLLYSMLPHKELRFIIYVFPLFNMASAAACSYIFTRRTKAPIFELLFWGTIVVVVGNVMLSIAFVSVAMTNYPGGVAMTRFHKLLKNEPYVHVHISNLAAQTGVTRFTEIHNHWQYSKNESLDADQLQEYTHLLIEAKSKYSPNLKSFTHTHTVLEGIETFSAVSLNYKLIPPIKIKTRPALFILQRKDFREYPHGHKAHIVSSAREEPDLSSPPDDSMYNELETEYTDNGSSESEGIDEEQTIEEEQAAEIDEPIIKEDNIAEPEEESPVEDKAETDTNDLQIEEIIEETEYLANVQEIEEKDEVSKKVKVKRAIEELKSLRKEKKRKAIAKIKSETRKEVVASAKEKLRELMKRHKKIAEELSDDNFGAEEHIVEADGRGDIPEEIQETVVDQQTQVEAENKVEQKQDVTENIVSDETAGTNKNIDEIVEEVIARLIDRKIYDDKTKPEDIKAEDRQVIQQIVEEILAEKMNYTRFDQ
ncbi:dol-P-Man:Man(7)GlcNAc(2)-PP-Dol alpha-1,6-mannosyltransferase [Leguminivora glycinivorella]|uniref:dol-P-Man:Man(7)GlcNAc(2)-PP-Dol alpha-1,6-mannosyltransferase n=1 Tax=Leguminivora glycinivorella TaxID=1035111 RepID=UPI00200EB0D2|nr:dol-P-Man:Man(7)GlcNAc(2)-PP-Dol alpha-1,6-mannosyltransferase [Leguminivora glycinivorella]